MLVDQDGIYDPSQYHDRLLLGLTGIMSEAELHIMRGRLYAGAYSYRRRKVDPRRKVPGKPATGRTNVPRDQWAVLLKDQHPAYISWEQFEANQRRLADNRNRSGNLGAPREGKALLGGLLVCGKCGGRMIVNYGNPRAKLKYLCQRQRDCYGLERCQSVVGCVLDDLVTRQAFRVLEPAALELSLAAAADIQRERQRLAEHWTQRRERARYEAQRAARQYHAVEPQNRLVARRLEHDWEQALLQQRTVEDEYERFQGEKPTTERVNLFETPAFRN